MIEAMRSKAASWVAKILAVFLIASFAVWGIGDMVPGRGVEQTVAVVDGQEITRDQLYYRFQNVVSSMRNRFGAGFDNRQAARMGMIDRTLDDMIDATLLSREAQGFDLGAGESVVRDAILNDPRFRGPGNRFDRIAYGAFLRRQNMSEAMFVVQIRDQIVRQQLVGAYTAVRHVPKPLIDSLYRYRNEKRGADIATIPYDNPDQIADPDAATLEKYFDSNKRRFMSPEYRDITTIYLDPSVMGSGLTAPEERIREEFEARKAGASVPEKRDLSQALLFKEEDVKKFTALMDAGKPFDEAAREVTGKAPQALGKIVKSDLPAPVAEVAFGIREKEIGEPVKSTLGWHIVRVNSIEEGREATLAELRPEIEKDIKRELALDDIIAMTGKIDDALAAGATIEDAAGTAGVQAKKFISVDASGQDAAGNPVKDYPKAARFADLASSLDAGESSLIEEADDGSYFILRVDRIIEPAVPPLDKIRKRVINAWKATQTRKKAADKAKELLNASADGFDKAIAAAGLKSVKAEPFTRFNVDRKLNISNALVRQIFKGNRGSIVTAAGLRGHHIARVTEIVEASPAQNKDESDALKASLERSMAQDFAQQFLANLRQKYSVNIRNDVLQRLKDEQTGS